MPNSKQQQSLRSGRWIMVVLISLSIGIALAPAAQGQTFQVLHSFTDGADGAYPLGVEMDRAGNLYGPMGGGGHGGVFKLSHLGAGWTVSPLYFFSGGSDGAAPSGLTIAADGTLYGTTEYGGTGSCSRYDIPGCGAVFRLTPPASNCRASYCSWNKTTLYSFQGFPDLQYPAAGVTFDQAGNFYGTAPQGGSRNFGGVYKLARSQGSWAYSVPYSFGGGQDGITPSGSLARRSGWKSLRHDLRRRLQRWRHSFRVKPIGRWLGGDDSPQLPRNYRRRGSLYRIDLRPGGQSLRHNQLRRAQPGWHRV